jgi:outer membrane lipoprotein-sorting protein
MRIIKTTTMKKTISFICLSLMACYAIAQDNQAKAILDKVNSKNSSYKTIKADFKFTTTSPQNETLTTESGTVKFKGDKYHITMTNTDIVFDGKSVYTYLHKENEINITKPEAPKAEKGDFFFSNPRDIFKVYNKDFKSKLIKEDVLNNNIPIYEIDLYPIDLKTRYTRIRLHIHKNTMQILSMKAFLKDGSNYFLEFSNFSPNSEIADSEFNLDTKKYPNAEVNDMRF